MKKLYSIQQLKDLVRNYTNGGTQGELLMSIIADLAWAGAIRRKRFAAGTPQGDDPAGKEAEEYLDRLQKGERIFPLQGVEETNGSGTVLGTYGDDIPAAGLMEGSQLCSNVGRPPQVWGTNFHSFWPGQPTGGCDEGGCGNGGYCG